MKINLYYHQVTLYSMFVAIMAFFARISDPAVGGTYMTMLNTLTNLGGNWPSTLALWAVDQLTWKSCQIQQGQQGLNVSSTNVCDGPTEVKECETGGGTCLVELDGYYLESFFAVIFGFLYLIFWGWSTVEKLQSADEKEWKVVPVQQPVKSK